MRDNKYNLSDEDFAKETELLELREKVKKEFGYRSKEYAKVVGSLQRLRNPGRTINYCVKWRLGNRKHIATYERGRKKNNSLYKFGANIRTLVWMAFNRTGYSKNTKSARILGEDFDFVLMYLIHTAEKRYGFYDETKPYHIDHIVPLSTAETEEEILKLCEWTNLQYLTPEDNLSKGDKVGAEAEVVVPFIDFKISLSCPEGCG